jgi:glycerol-3-phosphate O-acyltransferase / dihydroxyacetone phosphate acyltransferase
MKLYFIIRPIITLAFKIYFKKIYHWGTENIPQGKPILFSSNHPTGFFEPCLLACLTQNVEYNFMTRGDLFSKPLYKRIFDSLNMIPIFRFKDGYANLKNNVASMEYVYKALADKKSILLFTEGGTETVKRLRPLQKGLARMAFGSYDVYGDLDVQIVPVCMSYSDPHRFRSEVMVQFGAPIPLSNYYETYAQNNNKAVNQVTADIEKAMRPLLVEVKNPDNDQTAENLFTLYRNSFPEPVFPIAVKSNRRLLAHQEIADNINNAIDNELNTLNENTNIYFKKLENKGINDFAVAQPWHASFKNLLVLIIGFIPFVVGRYGHYLPFWYAGKIKKERVKYLEFEGPVMAAVGVGGIIIQYLLLIIAAFIINHWLMYIFVFLLPFLGYYAITYWDLWKKYYLCRQIDGGNTEGVVALRTEREDILAMVFRKK